MRSTHPHPAQQARATARRDFVGRIDELAELRAAVESTLHGAGRLVLLSGEPGAGKTSLARRAGELAAAGGLVAWGRPWDAGGAPPYWPWIEALGALPDSARRSGRPLDDRSRMALESAIAALRDSERAREAAHLDPSAARFALFEAVASALSTLASEYAMAIVLDDLHAATVPRSCCCAFSHAGLRALRCCTSPPSARRRRGATPVARAPSTS